MGQLYKMHDSDTTRPGMHRISLSESKTANEQGYGIFCTVNSFRGDRRIVNLLSVDAWAIDMDDGLKSDMLKKLDLGLPPSVLVETKRGFQSHWQAKDAKPEHWNAIVLDRLVPFYGADKNARDLARVMRVPGYFHLKNPKEPFLIKEAWRYPVKYTEADIAHFYPDLSEPQRTEFKKKSLEIGGTDNLWEEVWRLDCMAALERLSGTEAVGCDVFSFKTTTHGKFNILSNGKGTSCWIDADGRIGSLDKGGPTIFQWLKWYHRDNSRVISLMQKYFQELPWNKKK